MTRPSRHCLTPVRFLLASLSLSLTSLVAIAADSTTREREDLLALLAGETALATKSGMNADFVPGMATILDGEDLLMRGARTVWESLALVPGLSLGLEMTGERQVLSRGVGHGYASGNIKILLDGVSMNSSLLATANSVLNIPIEQVERIEVIRGPGSSVHGEYAYAGVIDIITRKRARQLRLQADEQGGSGLGGLWYWTDAERDLTLSMNLAGIEDADSGVFVREDALATLGESHLSNAPGHSNEAQRYKGAFTNLQWRALFLDLKLIENSYGDYFGINHFLPPADHNLASRHHTVSAQAGFDPRLSDTLSAKLRLEFLRQERDRSRLYVFPASYLADEPIFMSQDYQETRHRGSADLFWRPNADHTALFGLELSRITIDQAKWEWTNLPFEISSNWMDTDHDRTIVGLIVQDEYRATDRLTLTGTLRYDDYSDAGSMLSPRAAAVWRIDDANVLKAQYARAFRPPTFYELEYAAQTTLEASEIDTLELGYILTRPRWEARATLFHSDLTDPILFSETGDEGYVNTEDVRLRGVELEYIHRFGSRVKIDANLSYVDAVRPDSDTVLPGGARWLGNLALLWQPYERWMAAFQLNYVGKRSRVDYESRGDLGDYWQLDLTLNYRAPVKGLSMHAGVKNLADSDIYYPDILTSFGGVELIYPDGYPRPGRRWWVSLSYAF
ncbi:TonB-dependent receptor [Allochromatium humboldtianum]|uniref:TonB-dependent receptor n=1 Tax=Allochromatium humboldtianum TaxID=504901 RepID=A0A850RI14_9GAMM|nr:TonB-dependent receptor [Allochromatium humboldtianum]NVZ11087.1 TonB-dependent receptor [Allochromatium humboldtianum]